VDAIDSSLRDSCPTPSCLYQRSPRHLAGSAGAGIDRPRKPSEAGAIAVHRLGTKLVGLNGVVVSGRALCIDTKGHEGCVASGGKGVAMLAHGLHMVIPASNQLLASRLLESGGCLVSEYPYGEPPRKNYCVERERLQSGLADAVILVESAEQSGSIHTVRFTTLQKRIVGCVFFTNPEIPSAGENRSLVESGGSYSSA